jgi:ribosomal protein S18 acetylase RimI-like enzyme
MPLDERIDRWKEWLRAPDAVTITAERGGCVVGFGTLAPSPDEDSDPARVADMPTLYVHPDHWRVGIGRALCATVVDLARERGYETLTLWTMETNEPARIFYESLGFRADGARKEDPGVELSDILAVRFRLDLVDGDGIPARL